MHGHVHFLCAPYTKAHRHRIIDDKFVRQGRSICYCDNKVVTPHTWCKNRIFYSECMSCIRHSQQQSLSNGMFANLIAFVIDKHSFYDQLRSAYLHDLRQTQKQLLSHYPSNEIFRTDKFQAICYQPIKNSGFCLTAFAITVRFQP